VLIIVTDHSTNFLRVPRVGAGVVVAVVGH
jgi:hypothetical protein